MSVTTRSAKAAAGIVVVERLDDQHLANERTSPVINMEILVEGIDEGTVTGLVRPDRRFDLKSAFLLRQEQLLATLGVGRAIGGHPVAIGDSSELNWRGMLESVIPRRYQVSKAFVVDALGGRSEQIDLLVYDRHFSPMLIEVGEYPFVPAEAVYCALEVKQTLSRKSVTYASGKVASVRRLHRTSAPIPHAGGMFEPRAPARILGGIVSMDIGWQGLAKPLERALSGAVADGDLDLGCALQAGSFEVDSDDGSIAIGEPEVALIFFVLRLLKRLQRMASVPALSYDDYGAALELDSG